MEWDDLKWWETIQPKTVENINKHTNYKKVLPDPDLWTRAFDSTPFNDVKVVILGQDPYPTKGHAHGLAFSVPAGVRSLPPSLRNILREYTTDLHLPYPRNGDLSAWADRGVLLLNTILTVQEGKPLSHKGLGWEKLTIEVIQKLSEYRTGLVFILWGNHAQAYRGLIDESKHHVLVSVHPSPLSASRGFFGSRPFTRANAYLSNPIDWRLN